MSADAPKGCAEEGAGVCIVEHDMEAVLELSDRVEVLDVGRTIFQGTPERARNRLISRFSIDTTEEGYALGYEFDIVLRGANQTPTEA